MHQKQNSFIGWGCKPIMAVLVERHRQGSGFSHFDYVVLLGDSLAVELPALTRSALVRIQVPQPQFPTKVIVIKAGYYTAKRIRHS